MKLRGFFLVFLIVSLVFTFNLAVVPIAQANPTYEDFTTYSEYDDDEGILSQNSTASIWMAAERGDSAVCYKDYTADHFGTTLEHHMTLKVTAISSADASNNDLTRWYMLSNTYEHTSDYPTDYISFNINEIGASTTTYEIYLSICDGGVAEHTKFGNGGDYTFDVGTTYYFNLTRSGGTVDATAYSDSVGGTEIANATDTDISDTFRYILAPIRRQYAADPNDYSSGNIQNLDLNEPSDTEPPTWQSQSPANGTTVDEGSSIVLKAQGKDVIGLDWAWLSTNESGTWVNHTQFTSSPSNDFNDNKYAGNPVLTYGTGWEDLAANRPAVLYEDGKFLLWYSGSSSGTPKYQIGFANVSADLATTTKDPANPIINGNDDVPWLSGASATVAEATVIRANASVLVMAFTGDNDTSVWGAIGIAVNTNASDYNDWAFESNYVVGGNSEGNPGLAYNDTSDMLYLFYSRYATGNREVWYVETSYDPLDPTNFSWSSPALVVDDDGGWGVGSDGITDWVPYYIEELDRWEVGARCYPEDQVYFWYSDSLTNGGSWTYLGNPVETGSGWESSKTIGGRCAMDTENGYMDYAVNGTYYLFYDGADATYSQTGVATGDVKMYHSPLDMGDVANTWTWSNFTWINATIGTGTQVNWRIWYNDTSGNVNSTDERFFLVTSSEYDIVDNNDSNVDGSEDLGTHSPFSHQQDCNNSLYDTLTEATSSGEFPNIRSKTYSVEADAVSSHDVSLPPTVETNDTLLVFFVCDDNEAVTWPDEGTTWHVIYEEDAGNQGPTLSIAWKEAVGNEDGTTITVTTGSTEESAHISYAISGAEDPDTSPPEASSEASGSGTNPDPASLSPTGGQKNYLWFAVYGCDDDELASGYPTNYTDNQETYESSTGIGTCAIGACTREYASSSDDPTSFTIASEQWEAATIAVHPIGGSANYRLDLEVQWTSTNYTRTNEELCICAGNFSTSEDLQIEVWNATGTSWHWVMNLTASQWNNISVSNYLVASNFTIRYLDGTNTSDTEQSAWNIDCALLHIWDAAPEEDVYGVVNQQGSITHSKSGSFSLAISITHYVSVLSHAASSALKQFFGAIAQAFSSLLSQSFSFGKPGTIQPVFAVDSERAWSFTLNPSVNMVMTILGQYVGGAVQDFFGSITQYFVALSQKTLSFGRYGVANQVYALYSMRSSTFGLQILLNPNFVVVGQFVGGALKNFQGSIVETLSLLHQKSLAFSKSSPLNLVFSITNENAWSLVRQMSTSQVFTVDGEMFSGAYSYLHGVVNQVVAILSQRNYIFARQQSIGLLYSVSSHFQKSSLHQLFGSITQSLTVLLQRQFDFTVYRQIQQLFAVSSEKAGSFYLFPSVNPIFQTVGTYFSGAFANFFGTTNQVFSIASQRSANFGLATQINALINVVGKYTSGAFADFYGIINQLFTVTTLKSWSFTLSKTLNLQFAVASQRTLGLDVNLLLSQLFATVTQRALAFTKTATLNPTFTVVSQFISSGIQNLFGSITQQLTVNTQNAWSLIRHSPINLVNTISATIDYIQTRNVFSTIAQTFMLASERTWLFSVLPQINLDFALEHYANIFQPGVHTFFGIVNQIINILGSTDLPVPVIEYGDLARVLMIFAFVFSLCALAVALRNRKQSQ